MGTASHMPLPQWQFGMALDVLNGSTLNVPCIYAGDSQRLAFDLQYSVSQVCHIDYFICLCSN